jgi:hypothetical protein
MGLPTLPSALHLAGRVARGTSASLALVVLGFGLAHLAPVPSLPEQAWRCVGQPSAAAWEALGGLLLLWTPPVLGLWRLSPTAGMPRPAALLYPLLPTLTLALYGARALLNRMLPDSF